MRSPKRNNASKDETKLSNATPNRDKTIHCQRKRRKNVKFDICGEMNPLVFSALEGMNLVFTLMVSSTVMVDIVFARFIFCTFYWR